MRFPKSGATDRFKPLGDQSKGDIFLCNKGFPAPAGFLMSVKQYLIKCLKCHIVIKQIILDIKPSDFIVAESPIAKSCPSCHASLTKDSILNRGQAENVLPGSAGSQTLP
jgi:hypothetical protein